MTCNKTVKVRGSKQIFILIFHSYVSCLDSLVVLTGEYHVAVWDG